ncbi:hypothetical protein X986_1142 [Burkholderia pseudomallei]|nr:hypothetical protein BBK_1365 [Burkholderia pseudomallei NCTC 13179]EQA90943.1 hypothetical protein M218_00335 [Burkholderia pseudomallei MSHR338]KGX23384.1 hypothetical protein X984_1031 [Burkholderia pseudomallei]KGX29423.1 hypothetical protein X986_1142 [Burkholderia pseudomallei]
MPLPSRIAAAVRGAHAYAGTADARATRKLHAVRDLC